MLDESSAGAEVGVIWDATRARSEQCNTCFEKSGRLPVHLGLDHAPSRVSLLDPGIDRPEGVILCNVVMRDTFIQLYCDL